MGQEGDGWSQVSRKRGRKPAQRSTRDDELPGLGPNPNPGLSLAAIQKYHERVSQDWLESDSWEALQATLRDAFPACNRPSITKAICLGPGPFDPANDSVSIRRTAHVQTEAFRSIVANLEYQSGHKIKCIVQEPSFTNVDKMFCNELGMEVVESPAAFSMVDADTLVYGIHMELRTYAEALTTLPAIFVGAGLSEWEALMDVDPSGLESMRKMDAAYKNYRFPDLNYMFHGTTMYWREGVPSSDTKEPEGLAK
ncbi:hypothetical protein B0T18DRAFT_323946 [Schizothecium vesticola]|uniref:SRR1-like domain-containing protein n=1 Tax=Schizothecium vesticola TaxID=314040 RepID=A0AA40K7S7_9PEZI|nr:hypothetical protein B0T18DRAFT_323946 [Schizothecium vesticola]